MKTQDTCHFPTWHGQLEAQEQADKSAPTADGSGRQEVIYGDDNRKDLHAVKDPVDKKLAASTAGLFRSGDVKMNGNTAELSTDAYSVCKKEAFSEQATGAFCSASLVGDDLMMTAGHCISPGDEGKVKFVFGFGIEQQGGKTPTSVPASQVYTAAKVLHSVIDESTGTDYALVRLDRKVQGRAVLAIDKTGDAKQGDPMTVIGHPAGLPTKVADGAKVRDASPKGYFVTNLDTYGGNSGSAVFNSTTKVVEGILVRGETDFVWDSKDNCQVSNRVPDDGGRGEDVTKISRVRGAIEAALAGNVEVAKRLKAGSFSSQQVERGLYAQVWSMLQRTNRADDAHEPALVDRVALNDDEMSLLPFFFRKMATTVERDSEGMLHNDALCSAIAAGVADILKAVAGPERDGHFVALEEVATIRDAAVREVIVRTIETLYGANMQAGGSYERFARQRMRLIGV
ncbi:MAG: serine protease [Myxococcota bacterium]